eukprot:CAMPEP_0178970304 /NCGR_PEP_ID=MMETSP0789-20121207/19445_1 /TAXON_ID=3005 /ORGANISM="Rhizosolenia setigera, Strain CCMP 1694" /LENGTH=202 /DNA_ID=CAMNT_0020656749 /DNA_START=97 /DNA_END=705 /DNA_ORIENTATION=-
MKVTTSNTLSLLILASAAVNFSYSWQIAQPLTDSSLTKTRFSPSISSFSSAASLTSLNLLKEKSPATEEASADEEVKETTEKYGLEAGLFKSLQKEDGGASAKSLLKTYGVAYLATSIPLAIVSFAICYVLVDSGVDVAGLLAKVGIETAGSDTAEKAGTAAIAYAAHKAASPIRFPPTVFLTPVVAKLIGREPTDVEEESA